MPTAAKTSATAKNRTRAQRAGAKPAAAAKAKQAPAAKAASAEVGARELGRQRDLELAPKIAKARKDGKSWGDIKEDFGIDQPKGQVLIKMANLNPEDRITFSTNKQLGAAAAKLRKANVSWADIAVRAGVTIAKVKSAFEESTGTSAGESRATRKADPALKAAKAAVDKPAAAAKPAAKAAKPAAKGKTRRKAAAPKVGGGADPS